MTAPNAHAEKLQGHWHGAYLAASKEARDLRVKLARAEARAARAEARLSNMRDTIAGVAKVAEDGLRLDADMMEQFEESEVGA